MVWFGDEPGFNLYVFLVKTPFGPKKKTQWIQHCMWRPHTLPQLNMIENQHVWLMCPKVCKAFMASSEISHWNVWFPGLKHGPMVGHGWAPHPESIVVGQSHPVTAASVAAVKWRSVSLHVVTNWRIRKKIMEHQGRNVYNFLSGFSSRKQFKHCLVGFARRFWEKNRGPTRARAREPNQKKSFRFRRLMSKTNSAWFLHSIYLSSPSSLVNNVLWCPGSVYAISAPVHGQILMSLHVHQATTSCVQPLTKTLGTVIPNMHRYARNI